MVEQDFSFTPFSDAAISDLGLIQQHNQLINNGNFSEASNILKEQNYQKGYCACVFNGIRNKLMAIATYILNLQADPDEIYSSTMPSEEQMEGKLYWIQPFDSEEESV